MRAHLTNTENCAMLVAVAREQMCFELTPRLTRHYQLVSTLHRLWIHSSTFKSLIAAVSVCGLRAFERRETWTAERPCQLAGLMPSPSACPSFRRRSPRTKCG